MHSIFPAKATGWPGNRCDEGYLILFFVRISSSENSKNSSGFDTEEKALLLRGVKVCGTYCFDAAPVGESDIKIPVIRAERNI